MSVYTTAYPGFAVGFPPPLEVMGAMRRHFIVQRRAHPWSVDGVRGQHPYQSARARAMRPVLGQLRMVEAAIRMSVACADALAVWRHAA